MILPSHLRAETEWIFLGPLGPRPPAHLSPLPLLAVDGGADFAERADVWVGDRDSLTREVNAGVAFRHLPEKTLSDLALALQLFATPRCYKFHFWGFLGGRRDHELFNLGEALRFLEARDESQIILYDGAGEVRYHLLGAGRWSFTHRGLFSLGALRKTEVLVGGDCKYAAATPLTLWPLASTGLSNEAHGAVTLETWGPVFVYFPEGP
jgi:thiamine pyrophosphokinase